MILRGMALGSFLVRGMACYAEPVIPPRDRVFAGGGFGGGGEYITEWPVTIPEAGVDTDSFLLDLESLKRLVQAHREEQVVQKVGDVLSGIRESKPKRDTLDDVLEYLGDPRDPDSRFQKIKGYVFIGGSAAWSALSLLKILRKKASGL